MYVYVYMYMSLLYFSKRLEVGKEVLFSQNNLLLQINNPTGINLRIQWFFPSSFIFRGKKVDRG